jgi:hypothetical protein
MTMFPGEGFVIITSDLLTAPKKDRFGQHMGIFDFFGKDKHQTEQELAAKRIQDAFVASAGQRFQEFVTPAAKGTSDVSAVLR